MTTLTRRAGLLFGAAMLAVPFAAGAAPMRVTLYKNPECSCCEGYAAYLRRNGFTVDIVVAKDLVAMARRAGVPEQLDGCHITMIGGYAVIGHIPIEAVRKLLAERPKLIGISLPGMPMGVPGMPGSRSGPIVIYEIAAGRKRPKVFMTVS
jgi:hypothetical protein